MVSFQCEACGDVITRKKIDNHTKRCHGAAISCLDCMTTFYGNEHRSHTSCITEDQKYQGALYKEKKSKGNRSNPPSAPITPRYRPPTVEDAPNGSSMALATIDVPPPAPSPPPAPNVFDFLVEDGSPSSVASSRSSPAPQSPRRAKKDVSSPRKKVQMQDNGITYGKGPIEGQSAKYASDLSLAMDIDSQPSITAPPATHRTPAPKAVPDPRDSSKKSTKTSTEKKRKRPQVEELDLSESRKSSQELSDGAPVLHSGLTGGLAKMLGKGDSAQQSPLSPKKKNKHTKHETDSADGDRERRRRKKHDKAEDDGTGRHRRHKRHRSDGDEVSATVAPKPVKALGPPAETKAIEYHKATSNSLVRTNSRASYRSHSEFFLSLIDKGASSQKGQSIYGTLKSFHEGVCEGEDADDYEANGDRLREEKTLLRALRMKRNKNGEIVLFARPAYESGDEKLGSEPKRIMPA